jgi:hypothetical protein
LPFRAIAKARDGAAAAAAEITTAIADSRRRGALGDLAGARKALEGALARWPLARSLHDQMTVLDDGLRERDNRLTAARNLASEGKLREAMTAVLALTSADAAGEEARRLQADLRAKIDVVSAGVDQIRRAVHGRGSGSVEGLGHCIARLDELAKLQSDDPELARLRQALLVERRALELFHETLVTCGSGSLGPAFLDVVRELVGMRESLLTRDRLDARLLALGDEVAGRGEAECGKGRLHAAEVCLEALTALRGALGAVAPRVEDLGRRIATAHANAQEAVQKGRAALAAKELDAAESAFAVAHRNAADDAPVRELGREIEALRARSRELAAVEDMTASGDFARAHEKLATMAATPAALRTKIFDLKRSLARAQGLDGGFILRVDEGGEFLVLRSDSISIGNLRDGRSDLAVLANISGQHARVQRRMSFHGGMEDRILADRGQVSVNGKNVPEQRLRDGDEVSLGGQLRFEYRLPSSRSLTAQLRLLGGFQVRGTDRVLLLKDRGRDGRIIIGRARDAHVLVPGDGAEVELFAGLDGQVRVRCDSACTMDGRPFTGEHPVTAGAVVTCGDLTLVLQPLPPA